MKFVTDITARALTVTFDDGESETYRADDMPETSKEWSLMYGVKQRLSDAAAGALKLSTESELTVEELRKHMVKEAWKKLTSGDLARAKGEGLGQVSYLSLAIQALYGKSKPGADAILAAMDKGARKNLEASKKIAAWIAGEKARRAIEKAAAMKAGEGGEDELPEL